MIQLSWLATSTLTAESGGDTLVDLYRQVYLEGAETEQYTIGAEVTTHSRERGTDVADHVRPGLRHITLRCVVSDEPTDVRDILLALVQSRQILSIITGIGEYENMVITSFSEDRSARTGDALFFVVEAQEIRTVEAEEVEAPAPQVERGRRRTDRGRQPTTETTTTDAAPSGRTPEERVESLEALRRSVLSRILP